MRIKHMEINIVFSLNNKLFNNHDIDSYSILNELYMYNFLQLDLSIKLEAFRVGTV